MGLSSLGAGLLTRSGPVKTQRQRSGIARLLTRPRLIALGFGAASGIVPAVASAAEESGGIAALGISLPGLVAQLVNFGILLIVLRLFLFKPIMKVMDERKRKIEEGLQASTKAAQAAESSQEESRRAMEQARAEGRELIGRAQETAGRLREELEAQARRDADALVERARAEINREREQAVQSLRAEFADLTVRAAERVVGQSLDRNAHQRLIDETLATSSFGRDGN
ncbi:MAG: ATP synthase F0 subunit B [Dehalococcoidia bacterium]|nr:MAG: ATP synthase F0 subunit B [Dehalococcoidia bacterium]